MESSERILRATAELLATGGRAAVTTRAVSAAADVQAPTIYRHFGCMQGLLDATAKFLLADYLEAKRTWPLDGDPIDDLRKGWDSHVEFGLTNPAVYALLYGEYRTDGQPAMVNEGDALLKNMVERIAKAGRLSVPVERAVLMLLSSSHGLVLKIIATPPGERDEGLSEGVREAILSSITVSDTAEKIDDKKREIAARAVSLKAALNNTDALTSAEYALLGQWLDQLALGASQT